MGKYKCPPASGKQVTNAALGEQLEQVEKHLAQLEQVEKPNRDDLTPISKKVPRGLIEILWVVAQGRREGRSAA